METLQRTDLGKELQACKTIQEARQVFWMHLVDTYTDVEHTELFNGYLDYLDTMHDTILEMRETYNEINFDGENPFV